MVRVSWNKDYVAVFMYLLNILCKLAHSYYHVKMATLILSVVLIEVIFCYNAAKYEDNFFILFLLLYAPLFSPSYSIK